MAIGVTNITLLYLVYQYFPCTMANSPTNAESLRASNMIEL